MKTKGRIKKWRDPFMVKLKRPAAKPVKVKAKSPIKMPGKNRSIKRK